MDKEEKKYELLKLNYDNCRTWTLAFLALLISSFLGLVVLDSENIAVSYLFCIIIILSFSAAFFYMLTRFYLAKLRKYLKD